MRQSNSTHTIKSVSGSLSIPIITVPPSFTLCPIVWALLAGTVRDMMPTTKQTMARKPTTFLRTTLRFPSPCFIGPAPYQDLSLLKSTCTLAYLLIFRVACVSGVMILLNRNVGIFNRLPDVFHGLVDRGRHHVIRAGRGVI